MQSLLTIIIPCKNEEKYIYSTLESLHKQRNISNTKIIIADANSTDGTLNEVNRAIQSFKLNIQIIPGGTVSIGRNAGAKLATTPYLVFIDADTTIIDKDTLQECLNYCCIKNKKLITCNVKPITTDLRCKLLWSCFNKIQKLLPEPFCVGAFFFTEKQTFDELGGFDELVHQSEDFLLSRKYNKNYFYILNKYITQDDRRFKKMGYLPFIFLVLKNYLNKNEIQHFKQDVNYW